MDAITPYLLFNGNAAEALAFYSKALNGKVLFQQTYGDATVPTPADMKDKIMHASFQADKLMIMVSDCPPDKAATNGTNLSLSLNFPDIESIEKTFATMSEAGIVTMALQDTFWGARFGMLTDKFGFHWMFNHDIKK